jgi:putative N-acetylmannosamine-6-phosphate epimerase
MNISVRLKPTARKIQGGLIVSCQALAHEPLHGTAFMAGMALAAQQGGACAIRANGPADIRAIRKAVPLPILGLFKDGDQGVYITPTFAHARAIARAGADVIALDGTGRPRPDGLSLSETIARIHGELGLPVMADIAGVADALAAIGAGADVVATTLSGYVPGSRKRIGPDLALVRRLARDAAVPVIAEGRIHTPAQARRALAAGAFAVVVGGAITRPHEITARFHAALPRPG